MIFVLYAFNTILLASSLCLYLTFASSLLFPVVSVRKLFSRRKNKYFIEFLANFKPNLVLSLAVEVNFLFWAYLMFIYRLIT